MPSFSEEDKKRLFAFYNTAIDTWGPNDARSLQWTAEKQQVTRFQVLCEVEIFDGASILDVGCGFGDLCGYLSSRIPEITYLGIDINPHMIAVAQEKYPNAMFEIVDFGIWGEQSEGHPRSDRGCPSDFDFILASGAFSFKIENYQEVYFRYLKKMFELSKIAVACNFLDSRNHISDGTFATYDPTEVYDFCRTLTPHVDLRDDYLPQDFTVYLYR